MICGITEADQRFENPFLKDVTEATIQMPQQTVKFDPLDLFFKNSPTELPQKATDVDACQKTESSDIFPIESLRSKLSISDGSAKLLSSNSKKSVPKSNLEWKSVNLMEDFEPCPVASMDPLIGDAKLGQGTYGTVTRLRHKKSGEVFAVKTIDKRMVVESGMKSQVEREIKFQMDADHPNILKCFSCLEDLRRIYIFMECCDEGDLYQKMRSQSMRRFCERDGFLYFTQLVNGVSYMHAKGFFHRDLKLENLLISCDGTLKLADFGWIGHVLGAKSNFNFCDYLSPEMITGSGHDWRLDVWSVGILLYELLVGIPPFHSRDHGELIVNIFSNKLNFPEYLPHDLRDVIYKFLRIEPEDRLTLSDLPKMPWVQRCWSSYVHAALKSCISNSELDKDPDNSTVSGESQFKPNDSEVSCESKESDGVSERFSIRESTSHDATSSYSSDKEKIIVKGPSNLPESRLFESIISNRRAKEIQRRNLGVCAEQILDEIFKTILIRNKKFSTRAFNQLNKRCPFSNKNRARYLPIGFRLVDENHTNKAAIDSNINLLFKPALKYSQLSLQEAPGLNLQEFKHQSSKISSEKINRAQPMFHTPSKIRNLVKAIPVQTSLVDGQKRVIRIRIRECQNGNPESNEFVFSLRNSGFEPSNYSLIHAARNNTVTMAPQIDPYSFAHRAMTQKPIWRGPSPQ